MTINVTGAYGRSYTSLEKAKEDWEANKDFAIISMFGATKHGGSYINKSDRDKYVPDATVQIRLPDGLYLPLT